jgi:hypothetical protein
MVMEDMIGDPDNVQVMGVLHQTVLLIIKRGQSDLIHTK